MDSSGDSNNNLSNTAVQDDLIRGNEQPYIKDNLRQNNNTEALGDTKNEFTEHLSEPNVKGFSSILTSAKQKTEISSDGKLQNKDTQMNEIELTNGELQNVDLELKEDDIFNEIKETVKRVRSRHNSVSSTQSSEIGSTDGPVIKTSINFNSLPYGFIPKATYEHNKKYTDIMGVAYNGRMHQFIILDTKGGTCWSKDAVDNQVDRVLSYPKYEHRVIIDIVYAKKHNVYFALGKDFSLKVLNRDFYEVCSVSADLRSVLFMLFNPVRDELITGGVGGTRIWAFRQVAESSFTEIKAMANYRLQLKYELENVGGSWVKRVELDQYLQHLYCCSDTDLTAYDLQGNQIFKFENAHAMSITGCRYSLHCRLLVTSSVDTEVKVWSISGGHIHTFRGHARAISNLILHPDTSSLVLTSSLDGTVRMWSLDTMDCLYCLTVSSDGVLWMGLTDENLLYLSTLRNITLWSVNNVTQFWAMARNKVNSLSLVSGEDKSTRVLAIGEDSSIRVFARKTQKNMSTVLPPPSLSPLQHVKGVAYNRSFSLIFVLITYKEIWVYTARTDPACRIAIWDVGQLQEAYVLRSNTPADEANNGGQKPRKSAGMFDKRGVVHRSSENGVGNEGICECYSLCALNSPVSYWGEEGYCCPIKQNFLLLGLDDGRILFMDPVMKGQKYMEFKASKDAILDLKHDAVYNTLITKCHSQVAAIIQIWSLPQLQLLHDIYTSFDIVAYARLEKVLLSGHTTGSVLLHNLLPTEDVGPQKPKVVKGLEEMAAPRPGENNEHHASIVSVDVCTKLNIFVTASCDGAIKIWEWNKTLLTELFVDDTLTSACFLNTIGDLLIAYNNHIFYIDHSKLCPTLSRDVVDDDCMNEVESDVLEDPYVKYEGMVPNPDPIDLESYLVPYSIEFSKDFLEGKMALEEDNVEQHMGSDQEDSDGTVSDLSCAPTDIYISPAGTPRRLSMLDLTLTDAYSKYDLDDQLGLSTAELLKTTRRKKRRAAIVRFDKDDDLDFEMPKFGESPGPTPTPSPPSTPPTPRSPSVSEGGASTEEEVSDAESEHSFQPINIPGNLYRPNSQRYVQEPSKTPSILKVKAQGEKTKVPSKHVEFSPLYRWPRLPDPSPKVSQEVVKPVSEKPQERESKFAGIKIDVNALMKSGKKPPLRQTPSSTPEPKPSAPSPVEQRAVREVKKKELSGDRKRIHSGTRRPVRPPQDGSKSTSSKAKLNKATKATYRAPRGQQSVGGELSTPRSTSQYNTQMLTLSPRGSKSKASSRPHRRSKGLMNQLSSSLSQKSNSELVTDVGNKESATESAGKTSGTSVAVTNLEIPERAQGMSGFKGSIRSKKKKIPIGAMSVTSKKSASGSGSKPGVGKSPTAELEGQGEDESTTEHQGDAEAENDAVETKALTKKKKYGLDAGKDFGKELLEFDAASSIRIPGVDTGNDMASLFTDNDNNMAQYDAYAKTETPRGTPIGRLPTPMGRVATPGSVMNLDPKLLNQDDGLHQSDLNLIDQRPMFDIAGRVSAMGQRSRMSPRDEEVLSETEKRMLLQRPSTSFHRRTESPASSQKEGSLRARPSTGLQGPGVRANSELEDAFIETLIRYQSRSTLQTPIDMEKLYKNDGNSFEENWQGRIIDRHLLLKMQRDLRAQSANQKRHLLDVRQREKRRSLLGHREGYTTQSDTSLHVLQVERANSAPTGTMKERLLARSKSAHQRPPLRPKSAFMQYKEEEDLSAKWPFRHSLKPGIEALAEKIPREEDLDMRLMDPRNPISHVLRQPVKSIPSKCNRYILVTKEREKNKQPMATPLEEQLIAARFPTFKKKWLKESEPRRKSIANYMNLAGFQV
ncbi:unnamed protein product [Owenia fusiformis]|uniref:Uncharacterized protein n=1 Tax=Owenia fusiformis TaxID=6347 RepID=A0A8S4NMI1_OWEFU|nr:unnamed protein product [Owenia fusiformis]